MSDQKRHALCSPSSASGWLNCVGFTSGSGSSKFANEGTAAHELAANCLITGVDANLYIGAKILVDDEIFIVDKDMAQYVQVYLDTVRRVPGQLFVEQKLPVHLVTGEADAYGTADAVVLNDNSITILDLKYGMGVPVSAYENDQLRIYALAAIEEYFFLGHFTEVSLWIVQPRIDSITQWTISVYELRKFGTRVHESAQRRLTFNPADTKTRLNPSDKACRWCSKKAICTALANFVFTQISDDFVDLDSEENIKPAIENGLNLVKDADNNYIARFSDEVLSLLEMFIKAVRGRIEAEIFAGRPVRGWKLVQGKQGNRTWTDKVQAEVEMKALRLKTDEMYDKTIISPTAAEKLLAKTKPKQWDKLQKLIGRSPGKPSVAPESDKREALELVPTENAFQDETAEELI